VLIHPCSVMIEPKQRLSALLPAVSSRHKHQKQNPPSQNHQSDGKSDPQAMKEEPATH